MRFSSFESVFSEYFSTCSSKHYDVDRFLRNRSAKMTVFPFSITDTLLVFDSEDAKWLEWEDLLALFRPSTVTPDNESMASVPGSNCMFKTCELIRLAWFSASRVTVRLTQIWFNFRPIFGWLVSKSRLKMLIQRLANSKSKKRYLHKNHLLEKRRREFYEGSVRHVTRTGDARVYSSHITCVKHGNNGDVFDVFSIMNQSGLS